MEKTRSVTRQYLISDEFLQALHHDTSGKGFIDIKELRQDGTCSSLRNWWLERGFTEAEVTSRLAREQRLCDFLATGLMIMDDSNGNDVGVLLYGSPRADRSRIKLTLAANVIHPISVDRVYPGWTNARGIVIFGLSFGNE